MHVYAQRRRLKQSSDAIDYIGGPLDDVIVRYQNLPKAKWRRREKEIPHPQWESLGQKSDWIVHDVWVICCSDPRLSIWVSTRYFAQQRICDKHAPLELDGQSDKLDVVIYEGQRSELFRVLLLFLVQFVRPVHMPPTSKRPKTFDFNHRESDT